MAINRNKIVVLDFETDGKNPYTCSPVQLGAIVIDPRFLEIVPDSEFNSLIKPAGLEDINGEEREEEEERIKAYEANHQEVLAFHETAQGKSKEEIFNSWKNAPGQKEVLNNFSNYLSEYHTRIHNQNMFSAPIMAGHNIYNYDKIIMDRMYMRFNKTSDRKEIPIFHPRDSIDLLKICFLWFENLEDPKRYTLEALRELIGMSSEGAHDALQDVKDTAKFIIKFMNANRRAAASIAFRKTK